MSERRKYKYIGIGRRKKKSGESLFACRVNGANKRVLSRPRIHFSQNVSLHGGPISKRGKSHICTTLYRDNILSENSAKFCTSNIWKMEMEFWLL